MDANQLQPDRPWHDVAGRVRDWLVGYEQGHADAQKTITPDDATTFVRGVTAGTAIAKASADLDERGHAGWEHAIDRDLDAAQRLLREGRVLEAHRAISRVRRSLDAPNEARIQRATRQRG